MISFTQYLNEARSAPLYHGTSHYWVEEILQSNKLKRGFSSEFHPSKDGRIISLTRNLTFAFKWEDYNGVVFELDQQKIANRYKITPFNYFGFNVQTFGRPALPAGADFGKTRKPSGINPVTKKKDYEFDNQFEESVHQDITNLDKYITKIILYDYDTYSKKYGEKSPLLMSHPLLYDYKTKRFVNQ